MKIKTPLMLALAVGMGIVLGVHGPQYLGRLATLAPLLNAFPALGVPSRSEPPAPASVPTEQHDHDHDHAEVEKDESTQTGVANPLHDHASAQEKPTQGTARQAQGKKKPAHDEDKHDPGEDKHADEKVVRLSPEQLQQLKIDVAVARAGSLATRISLPGTVTLNTDRRVHIVPRVPGVVREVRKNLGDVVRAGEILAIIDSRDLADAKAGYLAARERETLAETTFAREKTLWEKRISPEEDFLKAKQALAEVRIELRVSTQKLLALGFTDAAIKQFAQQPEAPLTSYEVVAPFAGTVVEKRCAVGAFLKDDSEVFVIADLSTIWVDLTVAPKDVPLVRKGQRVTIAAGLSLPETVGTLSYLSPIVAEESRTVMARVVLPNPDGRWRPGTFVTATVNTSETPVAVLIPSTALQMLTGQPTVFVQTAAGFVPRVVTLGRSDATHTEITSGLRPGERYAATETFILKADLGKGSAEHQH